MPSTADVSVDGEKERRSEEKLRRKKNKLSESQVKRDEAYNYMEEVRHTSTMLYCTMYTFCTVRCTLFMIQLILFT